MFCQSCGQKNIEEARFCNFCGERIALPGQPGGRTDVPPSRSAGRSDSFGPGVSLGDSLTMSLAGLGIRTKGRAYGLMAGVAVALIGFGGVLVHLLTRGGEVEHVEAGHAAAGDGFLIGAPIPDGLELPPFPEVASEEPPPAPRSPRPEPPRRTTSNAPAPTPPPSPAPSPTPAPVNPSPTAPAPPPPEPTEAPPREPEPENPSEPEPRDEAAEQELELYSGRVRFAISRYYAGATRSCFDAATQRSPSLSGTVVVATKVGPDGHVKTARLARNSTGDQTLGECLVGQVRSFRLPPPPSGEIELKLPFSR